MGSVPVRNAGVASAINNALSRVGQPLIAAAVFIVVSGAFYATLAAAVPGHGPGVTRAPREYQPFNPPPAARRPELAAAAKVASTDAYHLAALVGAGLLVAGAASTRWGCASPSSPAGREGAEDRDGGRTRRRARRLTAGKEPRPEPAERAGIAPGPLLGSGRVLPGWVRPPGRRGRRGRRGLGHGLVLAPGAEDHHGGTDQRCHRADQGDDEQPSEEAEAESAEQPADPDQREHAEEGEDADERATIARTIDLGLDAAR